MTNITYWLWLATRCGARFGKRLLEQFGSPEAIWQADRQAFVDIPRLNKNKLDALMEKDLTVAEHIQADCLKQGIQILTLFDEAYPELLRNIPDPPLVLYVRGTLPDFTDRLSISIVGTRNCTRYGKQAAWYFAGNLAQRGVIIVSGMALGIDGTANRAAIEAGGETVAVLGCGVDVCYPWQHKQLMEDIVRHGAVISEYPPGTEPFGKNFPVRNRIITGLGQGTLIVEAPKKSGALISADLALEQGRDVFAVPGDINRPSSAGCNARIRQGAAELVQEPADILSQYQLTDAHTQRELEPVEHAQQPIPKPDSRRETVMRKLEGSEEECIVWRAVHDGLETVDAIVEKTGLPAASVLTALTMLEVGQYVAATESGYKAAADVKE
jgi:DNA processing protein